MTVAVHSDITGPTLAFVQHRIGIISLQDLHIDTIKIDKQLYANSKTLTFELNNTSKQIKIDNFSNGRINISGQLSAINLDFNNILKVFSHIKNAQPFNLNLNHIDNMYLYNDNTIISSQINDSNIIFLNTSGEVLSFTSGILSSLFQVSQVNNIIKNFDSIYIDSNITIDQTINLHLTDNYNEYYKQSLNISIPNISGEGYEKLSDSLYGITLNHNHKNLVFQGDNLSAIVGLSNIPNISLLEDGDKITESFLSGYLYNNINIPILQSLPIGSVIGIFQYKETENNQWYPKIPYGFYELMNEQQQVPIITNNIQNKYNNLPLAYLILRANHKLNDKTIYSFKLPKLSPIIMSENHRIIYMIKYNFHIYSRD